MSEANDIIQAIKTQLSNYDDLNYISSLTEYEDEIQLVNNGLFPYLNIDIRDFRVTDADNMNPRQMERRIYPILFFIGNKNLIKTLCKKGDGSFKGLFEIYDDLKSAIYSDRTFSNAVTSTPWRPDFASDVSAHPDGEFWIGRAIMIFEVYKDVVLV